ncbi:diaminopimelate epimerase [Bacillus methanolicus PB1]|uniref:Diaminopimelate epimerase n=1 Tax=Bacillus methanolicus PB1 TaxID=997296 RepID=I3DW75_BACMT|nr:diaminopimelate epimerase [Bacillus methanolicus]EIJ78496.1 diaminopimelate epimerase [Bacillus methanolicus PB1]
MNIVILKVHGSGNDFLLIDEISNDYSFTEEERSKLAVALCDRKTDLGADGILFVQKGDNADARMRIFNADGSEASMCGNGLRCVARYVCELYGKEEALINTMKADLPVKKQKDIFPNVPTYQVEISPVSFQLNDLPLVLDQNTLLNEKIPALSNELVFSALAVPNPHLVSIVDKDQIHSEVQKHISEYVNGPNELFPDGVNVSFVMPLEKGQIYVRTFERGVGFTNACGTAMSASSLVTCLNGFNSVEEPIEVYNNGGKVRCVVHQQDGAYTIDLIGNATYVYRAEIHVDVNQPESFTVGEKQDFAEEQIQYDKLGCHVKEHLSKFL